MSPAIDGGGVPDGSKTDGPIIDPDGGADTGTDGSGFDGGLKVETFANQVAEKVCRSLARCCYGNADLDAGAPVDGGTFDRDKCRNLFVSLGFEGSSAGASAVSAGNVTLDQVKGVDCLAKVDALACDLPATVLQATRAACFGAYQGKLANGAGCRTSIECGTGSFCKAPAPSDGGIVGTCEPLRAANGTCGDFTDTIDYAEEACSFRASGVPANHCDTILDFATVTFRDQADWKCVPNVANGQNCADSNWCSSGICNVNTLKCESPLRYFEINGCGSFVTP